jgi:hypothetical protein
VVLVELALGVKDLGVEMVLLSQTGKEYQVAAEVQVVLVLMLDQDQVLMAKAVQEKFLI